MLKEVSLATKHAQPYIWKVITTFNQFSHRLVKAINFCKGKKYIVYPKKDWFHAYKNRCMYSYKGPVLFLSYYFDLIHTLSG